MLKNFKLFGDAPLRDKLMCGFAAAMFETVIFIYFCVQNLSEILIDDAVIFFCVIFLVSVLAYLMLLMIFRKPFVALVIYVILCICLVIEEPIAEVMNVWWPWRYGKRTSVRLITLAAMFFAGRKAKKVSKPVKPASLLIGVLSVILAINIFWGGATSVYRLQ